VVDGERAYWRRAQADEVAVQQRPADQHSLNQKPATRPTTGECGK
jgi:hypothetical protein